MPRSFTRRFDQRPGQNSVRRMRLRGRVGLRLEMLETRCLMAAWTAGLGDPTPFDPGPLGMSPQGEYQSLPNSRTNADPATVAHYSETVPGPRDARASGASTEGGNQVPSSGDLSPFQVPYVVVNETSSPHQTFGSAQKLSDLPYFGVVGTFGNRDGIDCIN
jgi:hypothetical protein